MATFPLDLDYLATATSYRIGDDYVAKGTLFHKGKPVQIFETHGATAPAAEDAARAKAEEIWRQLKAVKVAKGRAARKR